MHFKDQAQITKAPNQEAFVSLVRLVLQRSEIKTDNYR